MDYKLNRSAEYNNHVPVKSRASILRTFSDEIELLAKMHILYRLEKTQTFELKKKQISQMMQEQKINVRTDLDPITRNLYLRYFT